MSTTFRSRRRWVAAILAALISSLLVACGGADSPPPTRRITGSRTLTFWTDQGKGSPLPSTDTVAPAQIGARSLDGTIDVSTGFDAAASFALEGAPVGPYLLEFITQSGLRHFYRTEAATIDLGGDVLGRSDARVPLQPTQMVFDVSGLSPTDPRDVVEITSSNASVWERLAAQGTLPAGLTAVSLPLDWKARPTPLLSTSSGDVLYVHQISTHVDPASGVVYQAAESWAQRTDISVPDGVNQELPVILSPMASTGRLTVLWQPSKFEAVLADWPARTEVLQHSLFIEGIAGQLDLGPGARSGNPDLLQILAPPGTADASLDLGYGRFLPPLWKERLQAYVSVRLYFPFRSGTIWYGVRMSTQAAMDALPPAIAPTIRPPRSVRIAGGDAFQVRTGVGTGPLIAWTAPSAGTPDYYVVAIQQLQINGTQVTFAPVATLHTTETEAQFPAGTLASNNQYVAFLTAVREPTGQYATAPAPYRQHFPQDFAQTATAPFSP